MVQVVHQPVKPQSPRLTTGLLVQNQRVPSIRVLLVADTHLGFDDPPRPRIERRRRGPDFFRNFELALEPALRGAVDLVLHGGDLLFRSRVPQGLVTRAFEPLRAVAEAEVPVVVVPGNHERSHLPRPLVADHPRLHVLNQPRTVRIERPGGRIAVAGFPFHREARRRFPELLAATEWSAEPAALRLLLLHQAIEGARVALGHHPDHDYTFRGADDVVRGRDLPPAFAAVLSGHIHRHQRLTRDLSGRPLPCPVFYPGSVERTSFAERAEAKGYLILEFRVDGAAGGKLERWQFHPLPARPMVRARIAAQGLDALGLTTALRQTLAALPADAVVTLELEGEIEADAHSALQAAALRAVTPKTMNLMLRGAGRRRRDQPR